MSRVGLSWVGLSWVGMNCVSLDGSRFYRRLRRGIVLVFTFRFFSGDSGGVCCLRRAVLGVRESASAFAAAATASTAVALILRRCACACCSARSGGRGGFARGIRDGSFQGSSLDRRVL